MLQLIELSLQMSTLSEFTDDIIHSQISEVRRKAERELDLYYAEACKKAPPYFTRNYILQSRSKVAIASWSRLMKAGVVRQSGQTFLYDPDKHESLKHGNV